MVDGFRKHSVLFLILSLLFVGVVSGCSSSAPVRAPETIESIRNLSNNDLMAIYGAALRSDFRNQDDIISGNRVLSEVEREAERRDLVNNHNIGEIEQGLVYLDMPIHQIFASIDGLRAEEHADFEHFVVSMYRGNKEPVAGEFVQGALSVASMFLSVEVDNVDVLDKAAGKLHRETVLICKNKIGGPPKIIGLEVLGTPTFEQFGSGRQRFRKIITNPAPGHYDKTSPESMKYYKSGQTPPEKPDKMIYGVAGSNRNILNAVAKSRKHGRLQAYFDDVATSSKYPSLLKYLESVC